MAKIPGTKLKFDSVVGDEAEKSRKDQGFSRPEFVARMGYENISRGCRKYMNFLGGEIEHEFIVENLHKACGVDHTTVLLWLEKSRHSVLESSYKAEMQRLKDKLRNFRPHGIITTEQERPSPVFAAAMTGSARLKHVALDFSLDSPSFVAQTLDVIPQRVGQHGTILAFGKPTGVIINLAPFYARRYDLQGNFIEEMNEAFHLGMAVMFDRKQPVDMARVMARVLPQKAN